MFARVLFFYVLFAELKCQLSKKKDDGCKEEEEETHQNIAKSGW